METSNTSKAAVIGGGLGGLAAAAMLARRGWQVDLFEKNAVVGGKMATFEQDGFHWDTGPSLLTMPQVLHELWSECGRRLEDDLELVRLPVTCRYRWRDGHVINEDEDFWQRPDVAALLRYGEGVWQVSEQAFLGDRIERWWRHLLSPGNWPSLRHLPKVMNPRPLAATIARHTDDPHVAQLFERFATYNGSSPYRTPSAFMIIPYVQAAFGGWFVKGGMFRIALALAAMAESLGVRFHTGTPIHRIRREQGDYLLADESGRTIARAPVVVCNQDVLTAVDGLLDDLPAGRMAARHRRRRERIDLSLSGFVMLLGVGRRFESLHHHNIFFGGDYRREFRQLFEQGQPADDPTIYIANSCKTEPGRAPADSENWFVLVNAPPEKPGTSWDEATAAAYGELVLDRLEQHLGEPVRPHIRVRRLLTPRDLGQRFLGYGGALYGYASHGPWASFLRPPMRPRALTGFWFVGGSTHPGGGIPLVLSSGMIAARGLCNESRPPVSSFSKGNPSSPVSSSDS